MAVAPAVRLHPPHPLSGVVIARAMIPSEAAVAENITAVGWISPGQKVADRADGSGEAVECGMPTNKERESHACLCATCRQGPTD